MKKKAVKNYVQKAKKVMLLDRYDVGVVFEKKKDKDGAMGKCYFDDKYLWVRIHIFPCFFKEDLTEQKQTLVHELTHVLIDPLYKIAINAVSNKEVEALETLREQTVEQLARFIKI